MALSAGTVTPWNSTSLCDEPTDLWRRRFVAKHLLDRIRHQRPIVDDLAPLVRMIGQGLAHPPDQAACRFVACTSDHREVGQQLVTRETTR